MMEKWVRNVPNCSTLSVYRLYLFFSDQAFSLYWVMKEMVV